MQTRAWSSGTSILRITGGAGPWPAQFVHLVPTMRDPDFFIYRRELPHWRLSSAIYFVTFRAERMAVEIVKWGRSGLEVGRRPGTGATPSVEVYLQTRAWSSGTSILRITGGAGPWPAQFVHLVPTMRDPDFFIYRRELPHWRLSSAIYFVTFRAERMAVEIVKWGEKRA